MPNDQAQKGHFEEVKDEHGNSARHYIRDGHTIVPFRNTVEECDKLYDDLALFKARPDDVWVCAFPKSGTHWVWEIASMLLATSTELLEHPKESAMLENNVADALEAIPSPRILNAHYALDLLPSGIWTAKNKVIHVMRNPKDTLVSGYAFVQKLGVYSGTFPGFVNLFHKASKHSWYDYELEWWNQHSKNPDVLFLKYEDIHKDHIGAVRKIANFLGVPKNEELFARITEKTSFQHMKANKVEHAPNGMVVKDVFYRKGKVGDWKNKITVAMNEDIDEEYRQRMKDIDLTFEFE